MPIYEFVCDKCDEQFERIVKFGTEKMPCPGCESDEEVRRVLSAFSYKSGSKFSSDRGSSCDDCSSSNCTSCSCH